MQSLRSVDVSTAEWRWVIVISGLLVTLTLVPFAWALANNQTAEDWHFMGMLSNPQDGATYLSKIEQGRQGNWLFELRHTPERHEGAAFHLTYILLGHLARFTGLSNLLVFHLARVAASLFMFFSIYQFGATIWVRLRPRRLFFVLASAGSGLGWLLLLIDPDAISIDFNIPEAFPFYAAFTNVHFPLTIGALAMIASIYMVVFRRGYKLEPSVENGGLGLLLLSLVLAFIQPFALLPIGAALGAYLIVRANLTRQIPAHELRWASMIVLPALPVAVYYLAVFRFNDVMAAFNEQNQTPSPAPHLYLFGYGLLLLVAIPGLARAFRRFERDGDQFMLLWFVLNVIGLYMPFDLQRRLAIGLIFPLVYFAVRSLEDYWFYKVPKEWRAPSMLVLIVFIVPTNVLVLGIPLVGTVAEPDRGLEAGLLVETDYWKSIQWLGDHGKADEVVLASPTISLWIPAYTDKVVVYGHPFETINAEKREDQVEAFYQGTDCTTLLGNDLDFRVRYIVDGPREYDLAKSDDGELVYPEVGRCILEMPDDRIQERVIHGDVTIYVLDAS